MFLSKSGLQRQVWKVEKSVLVKIEKERFDCNDNISLWQHDLRLMFEHITGFKWLLLGQILLPVAN